MKALPLALVLLSCSRGTSPSGEAPDVALIPDNAAAVTPDPGATDPGAAGEDLAPVAPAADVAPPKAEYRAIPPTELHAWLEAKDFLLINVHVPYAGDLPDTDANVPYTDLAGLIDALGHDKGTKAVVYCLTGPMSYKAAHDLVELGYWGVTDLEGGMNAWKAAGFPLVGK